MSMQDLAVSDHAYEIDAKLKKLKYDMNYSFIAMGYYLHQIKTGKLYEKLDYESFNSYISQPELAIKRSTAYKLVGIYETFVLEHKVSQDRLLETDYGKLDMIRTKVNEDNLEELLSKAESLSRSDLKAEVTGKEIVHYKKYCPHCNAEVDKLIKKKID